MRRGLHRFPLRRAAMLLVSASLAIAACSGNSDDAPIGVPSTTIQQPPPRVDDDALRLGALIPLNEPPVGPDLVEALEHAVEAVNDAGGVRGQQVEVEIRDEGTSPTTAAEATAELIEDGIDAIIGPTSSNVAVAALDAAVNAGIPSCSATATAISINDYPDDNLFFRSIATDSLQAVAIADQAAASGARNVVIVHVDDAYGQPYAAAVDDALSTEPLIRVTSVAVPFGDDDLSNDLEAIATARADTVVVLGNGDDVARILEAIDTDDDIDFTRILVNDAARAASSRPVIASLDQAFRGRIVGLLPQIVLPESTEADFDAPFASQIIDCVNLIALSTEQGDSDNPETIASQMTSVSSGGERCRAFASCLDFLDDDEQINYDGPTGITELARDGDPSRAFFNLFVFGDDGAPQIGRSLSVFAP